MYTTRVSFSAILGKAPELRKALEERVLGLQKEGIAANLSQSAFSTDFPAFHMTIRFNDLAGYEEYRTSHAAATADFTARTASLRTGTTQPVLSELIEVAPNGGPPAKWLQRITTVPALGKGPELRSLILSRGEAIAASGRRRNVSVQVAGPESGTFVRSTQYASLTDFEQWRARNAADPAVQESNAKIAALSARPGTVELMEVLIARPQT